MRVNPLTPERKSKWGEGGRMRDGYGRRERPSIKAERHTHAHTLWDSTDMRGKEKAEVAVVQTTSTDSIFIFHWSHFPAFFSPRMHEKQLFGETHRWITDGGWWGIETWKLKIIDAFRSRIMYFKLARWVWLGVVYTGNRLHSQFPKSWDTVKHK